MLKAPAVIVSDVIHDTPTGHPAILATLVVERLREEGWHLISTATVTEEPCPPYTEKELRESPFVPREALHDYTRMRVKVVLDDRLIEHTSALSPYVTLGGWPIEEVKKSHLAEGGEQVLRAVGREIGVPVRDEAGVW